MLPALGLTYVPDPTRRSTSPSCWRFLIALAAVTRQTPNLRTSSASLGKRDPGRCFPDRMLSFRVSKMCWYLCSSGSLKSSCAVPVLFMF